MQSPILIVARDGMIIKRQTVNLLLVFALQIVPADREQVRKHLERVNHQTNAAAMTMIDHAHRNRLNRQFQLARHEEHLYIKAKPLYGQATENFLCCMRLKTFESTLCIWQA